MICHSFGRRFCFPCSFVWAIRMNVSQIPQDESSHHWLFCIWLLVLLGMWIVKTVMNIKRFDILPNLTSSNSWLILSSRNQGNFLESLHSHLLFNPSPLAWLGLSEWLRWQLHLALKSATGLFFCQKKRCPFSPHLHQRSSPYLSTAEVELLQNHPIGRVGLHYYLFTLVSVFL